MKEQTEFLESEVKRAEDILAQMKDSTIKLFELFQCDPTPVYAVVGMF